MVEQVLINMGRARFQKQLSTATNQLASHFKETKAQTVYLEGCFFRRQTEGLHEVDQVVSQKAYQHPSMVFQEMRTIRLVQVKAILRFLDKIGRASCRERV